MAELIINRDNFEQEVMKSNIPVLIDLWAPWCGPCRMLGPVISEIAKEYEGKIKVGKVNVDDEEEIAVAFNVTNIPMLVLVEDGRIVNQAVGFRPKGEIEKMLQ